MCRERPRFRARGSHEARPGRTCAAQRGAAVQLYLGCAGPLRFHASSLPRLLFFVRFALPTHTVDPPTTTSPSSTTLSHAPPFALVDSPHHPYPAAALHSLTPPNRLFTHLTPGSSSRPPLQPHPYITNSPPLCARRRPPPGEILEQPAH